MNKQASDNFAKVCLWHFALAVGVFALFLGALKLFGWSEIQTYPHIQKDIFLAINSLYSNAPTIAHNLTQLGDASVSLALLLCFALITPKLWEALIASSLLSLLLCQGLKALYAMPRPARVFGDSFNIIGEKLMGANSFPSGHTVTIFTILFIILFALIPKVRKWRLPFILGIILLGALVGLSRVGVGAHYPLDVLGGVLLGSVCGIFGALIASRTRAFAWLDSRFGLLIFTLFCAVEVVLLLKNINKYNLAIFYLALIPALVCLFVILRTYFTRTSNQNKANATAFVLIISAIQVVFFYFPLLEFVRSNLSLDSLSAIVLFVSFVLFSFTLTAFVPLLLALISFNLTKIWFALTALTNALAVYFVATYGVLLDKTMMGNLFNTNIAESSAFLSPKMALWIFVLGIIPAIFVLALKVAKPTRKALAKLSGLTLLVLIILAGINFKNLLWLDRYAKQLGALAIPYSYIINSVRYFQGKLAKNKREIPLPNAHIIDDKKSVVVLVIGESARAKNFSLYGYSRETNPLLAKVQIGGGLKAFLCQIKHDLHKRICEKYALT